MWRIQLTCFPGPSWITVSLGYPPQSTDFGLSSRYPSGSIRCMHPLLLSLLGLPFRTAGPVLEASFRAVSRRCVLARRQLLTGPLVYRRNWPSCRLWLMAVGDRLQGLRLVYRLQNRLSQGYRLQCLCCVRKSLTKSHTQMVAGGRCFLANRGRPPGGLPILKCMLPSPHKQKPVHQPKGPEGLPGPEAQKHPTNGGHPNQNAWPMAVPKTKTGHTQAWSKSVS